MSIGFSFMNYPDTPTNPVPTREGFVPTDVNYAADWRVVSEGPGELVLTNIRTTGELTETIRFAYSEVKDIFKGTNLSANDAGFGTNPNKTGVSILVQANLTGVDGQGNAWPCSAHLVLKVPQICTSGADLSTMIKRLMAHLYETGADEPLDRLNALIKGALQPVGI